MQEFKKIIEELIQLFQELSVVEQDKFNATAKNRITFVEDCMNQEQVLILKLRGLEKRRENEMQKLGFFGKSFREILELVTVEQKAELEPLFHELSDKIKAFKQINDEASKLIEVNLHKINKQVAAAGGTAYGEKGQQVKNIQHFTSRKI